MRIGMMTAILTAMVIGALAVTGGGGSGGSYTGTAPVTSANLWITKPGDSAGSCTRSSSPASYSAGSSCGASQYLDQAVSAASIGDTIGWPYGTYASAKQTILYESRLKNLSPGCDPLGTWGSASTVNCIRIAPGDTGTGSIVFLQAQLENHASAIWFDGPWTSTVTNIEGVSATPNRTYRFHNISMIDTENETDATTTPDHVTITGWWVEGGAGLGLGAHFFRFSQGDVGGYLYNNTSDTGATTNVSGLTMNAVETNVAGRLSSTAQNIVLDHTFLHDINNNAPSFDPHDGCMFVHLDTDGVTFDSNIWRGCWVYAIQVQGSSMTGFTIQNNWFQCGAEVYKTVGNFTTCGQRPIQFDSSGYSSWLIRYNTFNNGSIGCYASPCTFSNVRFIANIGPIPDAETCGATGTTWSRNAWIGGTCGGNDASVGSITLSNTTVGSENFHLSGADQTSIDNVVTETTSDYALTRDIDDQTRPAGTNRDAGSDER